ncbi:MAG: HAMP domain-containing sensor histidine kinase [Terricaulis sp.]
MADPSLLQRDTNKPTLFRQIAVRLATLALIYALLNIAIVVSTYSRQPESLAQELLSLEARRMEASTPGHDGANGPPGAREWFVQYFEAPPLPAGASMESNGASLVDWTQRERLANGFRISGVRTIVQNGEQRWLYMRFEGSGLQPYVPVLISEIMQHVALPLAPLSMLMLIFTFMAVRQVLHPLRQAEREVNNLGGDTMKMRLTEYGSPREISTMVRAVNRALDRLDRAMDTLRDFTANAAHELRTPLSIMQLTIDRLPPSEARDDLKKDAQYLSRLVGQMLDLAQADALSIDDKEVVDLAATARKVIELLAPKAFRMGCELRLDDLGQGLAIGHEEAIFRMLRNLIDNALSHAPTSPSVEVVIGPGPQISVRDYGPGIPMPERERVFDRFWRSDRRGSDGAGLGLGIVKRLAEAHHGRINIEDPPGDGVLFRITLAPPLKDPDTLPQGQD